MQLVVSTSAPSANTNDYPVADPQIVSDVDAVAANDCASGPAVRHAVDVNALVGRIVGHVMSKLPAGPSADVQLNLVPGRHVVQVDPVAMSFALSGVLTAQLAAVDEPEEEAVSVSTSASVEGVSITFSSTSIPPLGMVRAVSGDGNDPSLGDPTLAHCRRLIEEQGGSIALVAQGDRIALRIAFPPAIPTNVVPLRRATTTRRTAAAPRLVA